MTQKTTNQREEEILRELHRAGGSCRVSALAQKLSVSNETIRRNVKTLQERRIVRKVHGGVHLNEEVIEPPFENRLSSHADVKTALAQAVAETISDGDSVFLDIGSTTAYVALALRNHSNLFVVTNSVFVAQTLAMRNNNRVFLAGGELRAHDGGAFGAEALDLLRRLNVQLAVFSVGAVNSELGFMLHDLEEANIARVAAENAQVCIVVADSGKFNKRAPVSLDKMSSIDVFFTDSPPPDGIREMLDKNEIETVVVEGKERHAGWSKLLAKNKTSPTP
ncbi:transcriptional regulator, DeoR family [Phaeobacter inhibens]|uniref:Transcriptional regulator, DeoR family n=1 Tax=Phaeobacter inhibens TaxID=221822 RepID=A0ABM6RBZ4_9RHOB|nr:DeoR/GlpR family DNA-binding transcription regulator [Phaeobacter inhibens]AUQ49356.1 transcriptional regulator, DeoR family [Phaeobacter inhibens]AUQ93911.1 transcriptional regulator, DeoR family [Phaeobacter inhibens]AUR19159.1 transcriptional regulator, DeoR family [Phaeobacter inhibens]